MTTPNPTNKTVDTSKIVNIIMPKGNGTTNENSTGTNTMSATDNNTQASTNSSTTTSSSSGYIPPRTPKSDEDLFAEQTFSEKCFRFLVVIIYLGGLSGLGFMLSIYYLFFWDSRMPPVFKPTKKPPVFIKP